jgi:hypothetical protein
MERKWAHKMPNCKTHRSAASSPHHFPTTASPDVLRRRIRPRRQENSEEIGAAYVRRRPRNPSDRRARRPRVRSRQVPLQLARWNNMGNGGGRQSESRQKTIRRAVLSRCRNLGFNSEVPNRWPTRRQRAGIVGTTTKKTNDLAGRGSGVRRSERHPATSGGSGAFTPEAEAPAKRAG